MTYYPNREPPVILECGCIDMPWLAIHLLGERDKEGSVYRLWCNEHPSPNVLGWKTRKATNDEIREYYNRPKPNTLF